MSRILIVIKQSENRRLLAEWLKRYYEVTIADSVVQAGKTLPLLDEPFDLCILDGPALDHLWEWVQARKYKEQPVFLPFLLITARSDVNLLTRHLWQTIDELITKPLEKLELQARVEMLLRSRQLSLQLQTALKQERELKEQKSRFVSMVSHEFRNPLNIINGFVRLLQQRDFNKEQQNDFFQRIQTAVTRMVALLDDVLILGKSEANSLTSNPTEIVIEPFCRKLIEEIKLSTGTNHIIDFNYVDECVTVYMDEALVRHILTNLLSNAIKYSAPDSTVQLRLQCQSETVIFQVQDQGIGIAPADQERLFESFYRASNVSKIPGTGLGLTIVKQLVEQQGGTIMVNSEINVGTTFTVTLPINSEILRSTSKLD
ncbi:HAMP domain-containing histidine kinase [Nostoc sp. FACHB-152]|uniref:hybrid sensor histidine kinase/response regulator n=1 Tax=unclassified Nostoc TaxID=2593658 RepID=UPI0016898D18|nr:MULTISPECIES: HAMP domain-containing sensor histidine kinase [unclassified Nostoc]MBD2449527.1 HAMP domain-containing histidine kinase [Nostoc sp. FACHB-152]MBD2470924.1 HAMP domain-containing histidine kinase [Nostoc sp. FACHB-145]